ANRARLKLRSRSDSRITMPGPFFRRLAMRVGPRRTLLVMWTVILALMGRESMPQDTSGPPPSSAKGDSGEGLHELLPDLGRIGAQVGVLGGASWNPYQVGTGFQLGGYVDLPLVRAPAGK